MKKNVLVTGAAKRLGRAIALDLAADGWNVAIHYNSSEDDADSAAQAVRAFGAEAAVLKCDLSKEAETATLVERAAAEIGPLTALINSASLFENDDWQSATRKTWDDHIETNLRAPMLLSQHFAKQLAADANGNIINIIDQRVLKPTPQFLSYSLSKAGLHWLTVTLAQSLGPRIRVNAVAPGPTLRNARQSENHFKKQQASTILGRGASPEDVAAATHYLLDARAVTGQMIAVDGGQHLAWRTADLSGVE